jgi:hypothetical protein
MNDNLLYNPSKLGVRAVLTEHVEQLNETLNILEMQVTELVDNKDVFDMLTHSKLLKEQQIKGNS